MSSRNTRSKNSTNEADTSSSVPLELEMELIATKGKNSQLTKANTKLHLENSELRNSLMNTQRQLFDLETDYNSLMAHQRSTEQSIKNCVPHLIDILNLFLRLTGDKPKTSFSVSSLTRKSLSAKPKGVTQAVTPHKVNGTVLNLNPTISLTRFNTDTLMQGSNDGPSTSGTSRESRRANHENDNINSPNKENIESEIVRSIGNFGRGNEPEELLNGNDTSDEEINDENNYDNRVAESSNEETIQDHLSTIREESMCSISERSILESRGNLNCLSERVRRLENSSFSSVAANVNDTCQAFDNSLIEQEEPKEYRNLTIPLSDCSLHFNLSVVKNKSTASGTSSTQVTPSTSTAINSPSNIRFPTPSMSAIGDIQTMNGSKVDFLNELSLMVEPSSLAQNQENIPITPRRTSRSKLSFEKGKLVPSTSQEEKSLDVSACGKIPVVVLQRFDNEDNEKRLSRSLGHHKESTTGEDSDEPTKPGRKRTRSKTKSKTPKKSAKKRSNELHEKIKEVQKRLANYVQPSGGRPSRAAKPMDLTEPTLKSKMRRT